MRAADAALRLPRAQRTPLRLPAQARRHAVVAAALLVALATLYLAWFRDSSFVRVDRVAISGLSTPDAGRLRAELTAAGLRMSTLDVDADALRAAVAHDPVVRAVDATGDFPSTLRIDVVLNIPVATLAAGRQTVAVSGDGTLLRGLRVSGVPLVRVRALPHGARLGDRRALALVAVASAAPAPLRAELDSVDAVSRRGLVARLRTGPAVVFGDATHLAAKWAVAAAVLAQPSSAGATYVDVHDPGQPIAAGLPLPDGGVAAAQPNSSDPSAPGVVSVTPPTAAQSGAPTASAATGQANPGTAGQAAGTATGSPAAAGALAPGTNTRP